VSWKGYNEETWEPEENVTHSEELLQEFHKRHPSAPQRISAAIFSALPWQPITNLTVAPASEYAWEHGRRLPTIIEDDEG